MLLHSRIGACNINEASHRRHGRQRQMIAWRSTGQDRPCLHRGPMGLTEFEAL